MQVTALNKQSLPDLAIQEFGFLEPILAMSVKNDMPVTSDLSVGQVIEYDVGSTDRKIVEYLKARNAKPATAISRADAANAPFKGIGYMAIERDFIVK